MAEMKITDEMIEATVEEARHHGMEIDVNDVISLLQAAEAVRDDWQPIVTAPKGNIRILVNVPPYGVSAANGTETIDGDFMWNCHSVLNRDAQPTHWQPLPEPPRKEKNNG